MLAEIIGKISAGLLNAVPCPLERVAMVEVQRGQLVDRLVMRLPAKSCITMPDVMMGGGLFLQPLFA